jgi:hypothetical protein
VDCALLVFAEAFGGGVVVVFFSDRFTSVATVDGPVTAGLSSVGAGEVFVGSSFVFESVFEASPTTRGRV